MTSSEIVKDLMPQTPDLNAERVAKLKELFPDLFDGEGELDEDELRRLIDPRRVAETERYEFRWFGKSQAKRDAFAPAKATLVFDEARSANPHAAANLIIEGENLEVLKLLLGAYRETIKCIYIDPPYNTGQDFIYKDNYTEARRPYWEQTGVTENGVRVDTNADTHGRFHSNWLNMMYSRLLVARQLLKPDGVIFISIDDNEVHNLRRLCDEVFGEENFINIVTVATKVAAGASGGGEDKRLKKNVELLVMYARNYNEMAGFANAFTEAPLFSVIKSMKENGESWKYTSILAERGTRRKIKTIEDGEGRPIDIYLCDKIKRTTIKAVCEAENISEEEAYRKYFAQIFSDTNAQTSIRTRIVDATPPLTPEQLYEVEYTPRSGKDKGQKVSHFYIGNTVRRVIWLADVAYEKDGALIKKERLGTLWDNFNYNNVGKEGEIPFANGKKPIDLIKTCISLVEGADRDELVLDFFAGSGSTGHAVLDLNRDGGRRKFILVQLPELTGENSEPYRAGYKLISDITIERNRRVVERMTKEKREAHPNLFENPGDADALEGLGYKVFKLEKSCFPRAEWSPDANLSEAENVRALKAYIAEQGMQLDLNFDRDKLLGEILLKENFKLNYAARPYDAVTTNHVLHVTDQDREALVCLDSTLEPETVEHFKTHAELKFICLERALDPTKKWNLHHVLGEKFKAY